MESRFYEGCGREGPIRCIFLCEFHPVAGPKITCQVPADYVSKENFDAVSVYIIPKAQLQRSILTVTVLGKKITGFPISIDNPKYARNAFYFNLCFVFDSWARTVHFEPVVKKLSEFLVTLEMESGFLSNDNCKVNLPNILQTILQELNRRKMCTVVVGSSTTHLKVVRVSRDPTPVDDHQVPCLTAVHKSYCRDQWDLTTQQVIPFIDGFNHVAKIAAEADVENNLVKSCIQNLLYYGVVRMISIFRYSAEYATTPKLRELLENIGFQKECMKYVAKSSSVLPSLRDILAVYGGFRRGVTVRELCVRLQSHLHNLDMRKLVQFGVLSGVLRRIHEYPVVLLEECASSTPAVASLPVPRSPTTPRTHLLRHIHAHLHANLPMGEGNHERNAYGSSLSDRGHCSPSSSRSRISLGVRALSSQERSMDEICVAVGCSFARLSSIMEADPSVIVLRK
ncbi:GATOR complex protein NPRL2 [Ischnura elegans]|uniref:GATOR complex protein NPRL2 n=1 Tax=Ischnura elegans TaxID=197161 RepID=UPI001ED89F35|nr:GATOR complex protein NPRL2 [Ischnura elegans]